MLGGIIEWSAPGSDRSFRVERDVGEDAVLTIVTRRHPSRPKSFRVHDDSVRAQTSKRWSRLLIYGARTLAEANHSIADLASHAPAEVFDRYVLVLDDDDAFATGFSVEIIVAEAIARKPDVVLWKTDHGSRLGILPKRPEPILGGIGSCSFAVRTPIFRQYAGHWHTDKCADFSFIHRVWDTKPRVSWIPDVLTRVQRISAGAADK